MAGSMREKKPGVWQLRVFLGRTPDGRQRVANRTVTGSERMASKELAKMVAEMADTRPAAESVAEVCDRWLTHLRRLGRAHSTTDEYEAKMRLYVLPTLGALPIGAVNASHLDRLYGDIAAAGKSPQTIRHVHAIVRAMLHQAQKWDLVQRNVASLASPPTVGQREQRPPTAEQVRAAMDAAEAVGPQVVVMVRLAATTGARRGELAALQWGHVDLAAGTVLIEAAIDRDGSRKSTKARTTRRTQLDAHTVEMLRAERARQQAIADTHLLLFDGASPVLAPWPGQAYSPSWLTRAWIEVREAAGLPETIRLHDLRHYVATSLLAAGIDVASVAKHVGHKDATTTLRIYAHGNDANRQRAADLLGAALS